LPTRFFLALCLLGECLLDPTLFLRAQATPAASRAADLQIGGGYTTASATYVPNALHGFAAYADLDFNLHLGVEAELHQAFNTAGGSFSEKTYEIGARGFTTIGPFVPYGKAMIGHGTLAFPNNGATPGYTLFAAGAGLDYKLAKRFHLRADYEFQKWSTFQNGSFSPQLLTFGAAYHFDGTRRH
jgi:opacity protein-like surface antigen